MYHVGAKELMCCALTYQNVCVSFYLQRVRIMERDLGQDLRMQDGSDGRSAERRNEIGFTQVGLQAEATLL